MEPSPAVAREERWALAAALGAFATVALYVLSVILEQSSGLQTSGPDSEQVRSFHDHAGALLLSTIVRSIGFLALCIPLLYLFGAARARSERVRPEMVGFVFIGPVLLAAQGVVSWAASKQIGDDFVAMAAASERPVALAERLIDDSSLREIAAALLIPAVLGLMVALLYISLQAMRTGLLPRFAGSLGMALGVAMILILPVALLLFLLWLLYVGLLILGRIPGGKPPAWTTGEAIPWPTPGEKAAAELQASNEVNEASTEADPDSPTGPADRPEQERSR
ncbi:MAG TPA: hypothetical protein VFY04_02410 [Solirubrobacterales bacterium]|nr:hypothetical protein [Solirubrobacterales bacterium]